MLNQYCETIMSEKKTVGRPQATQEDVRQFLLIHYDLIVQDIRELASYSCRNFYVRAAGGTRSALAAAEPSSGITEFERGSQTCTAADVGCTPTSTTLATGNGAGREAGEYVLKILNHNFSSVEKLQNVRQQMNCAQFLKSQGFLCPAVINTKHGDIFAPVGMNGDEGTKCHALLLRYISGQQLGKDTRLVTPEVLFEVGTLLAKLHEHLKTVDSKPFCASEDGLWMLENMHQLKPYLLYIQDEDKRKVMSNILDKFEAVRNAEEFSHQTKGLIHGDFHDYNIIVAVSAVSGTSVNSDLAFMSTPQLPTSFTESFIKSVVGKYGIIDFEDMHESFLALEICRLIADMMSDCPHIDLHCVGGHIVAGYALVSEKPVKEFPFFYETLLACLAQYIILGSYEYQAQDGQNDYLLLGSSEAWCMIQQLKNVEPESLYKTWNDILHAYGIGALIRTS